jgi:hypothetical protein
VLTIRICIWEVGSGTSEEVKPGAVEAHNGTMETHLGNVKAHNGAEEAYSVALEGLKGSVK